MKDVTFTVSIVEANTILKALGKIPYEESAALIQKLQLQGQMQVKGVATEKTLDHPPKD